MDVNNKDVANNMGWQFLQKFSAQIVTFLVGIVLARLLSPEEYGTVALVQVVVTFFDAFSSRGFNQALIQKKNVDSLDYSTVFWFNMFINAAFYAGLMLAAPWIARFYSNPQLSLMLQVLSVRLLVNGFNAIQHAFIQKNMQFKKLFLPTMIGTVTAAGVGLGLAFCGAGAWALVIQSLINTIVTTLALFLVVAWRPKMEFSFVRLKAMSHYGLSMLFISLAESVYNELRALVIGKLYTSADLAYHDKGKQLPNLVMSNIQSSLSTVFFSALTHENSFEGMGKKVRQNLNMTFFVLCPVLIGLASVSKPLITVLYTEKWNDATPYMILYCITYLTWVIQTPLLQGINAIGKADTTLKITLAQCVLGIMLLLSMMPLGPVAVAESVLATNVVITIIILVAYSRYFSYNFKTLLEDIGLTVVQTCLMAVVVYLTGTLIGHIFLKLILQVLAGVVSYILTAELFSNKAYLLVKTVLMGKLRRKV